MMNNKGFSITTFHSMPHVEQVHKEVVDQGAW